MALAAVIALSILSGCGERGLPDVIEIDGGHAVPALDTGLPITGLSDPAQNFSAMLSGDPFPLPLDSRETLAGILTELKYVPVITKDKLAAAAVISKDGAARQQFVIFEGGFILAGKGMYSVGDGSVKVIALLKKIEREQNRSTGN